jgi:uncharacterized protein
MGLQPQWCELGCSNMFRLQPMPLLPIKLGSTFLSVLLTLLTSLTLVRELGKDGLRTALARVWKGAWIFVHPRTCFKVAKVLTSPKTWPIVQAEPRLMFRYLGAYLVADLSRKERASILIDHYAFLKDRVEADFFRTILDCRLELWQQIIGEHTYRICMIFPRTTQGEGELSLIFEADRVDIYTLSFAIGPGSIAGLTACRALYIVRVQGKGRGLHLIRSARKNCLDVSPAALLLAAAEGVATALGLNHMIGIGAHNQISTCADSPPEGMVKAYDEFWLAVGGFRLERNMYHLTVPLPRKPIQSIKRNHRSRVLRKREFRKGIKEAACRAFRDVALGAHQG